MGRFVVRKTYRKGDRKGEVVFLCKGFKSVIFEDKDRITDDMVFSSRSIAAGAVTRYSKDMLFADDNASFTVENLDEEDW